jgi:hypothetical protein
MAVIHLSRTRVVADYGNRNPLTVFFFFTFTFIYSFFLFGVCGWWIVVIGYRPAAQSDDAAGFVYGGDAYAGWGRWANHARRVNNLYLLGYWDLRNVNLVGAQVLVLGKGREFGTYLLYLEYD